MKVRQLFDKLIENWQVKAVCFVISLFLYVIYQNQSVDTRVFSVPLGIEAKNGFVSVEPSPRTVAVSARGRSEDLAQVRESDLKAYLNLSYVAEEGSYDFPVLITLSDSASVLNPLEIKVTPERVHLKVEEEITSYVNIEPLVSGNPASGYAVKKVSVSPDQIAIEGPRSMIEKITSLRTLNVTTSGAKRSFSSKTKVEQKGIFIRHEDLEVSVTVEIEEMSGKKKFTNLPVNFKNIPANLELSAKTSDVTVTLEGSLPALESFTPPDNFVVADASKIESAGTHYIDLTYTVPKRFKLSDDFTKSIPVTFTQRKTSDTSPSAAEEKITLPEAKVYEEEE